MEILYSSLHNLDLNLEWPTRKGVIPEDFNNFIETYINYAIAENKSSRSYTSEIHSDVLNNISQLFVEIINSDDNNKEAVNQYSDSIALKLLHVEKRVQNQIKGINDVQKGSIVQALINDDNNNYVYVIAKVEHAEWYDGETLIKNLGFPGDNKRVWKSVVMVLEGKDGKTITEIKSENDITYSNITAYVNTEAKYWTEKFLEVKEVKNDSYNTKAVLHTIEKELQPLKENSSRDYYILRNAVIQKLQSEQEIDYNEMIEALFGTYCAHRRDINIQAIKEKLLNAPHENNFDTQFHSVPEAIQRKAPTRIAVSSLIDITIKGGVDNWENNFLTKHKNDGKNYLMIRCENETVLKLFPEDND